MRDPKGKTVADMFPDIFDDEEDDDEEPPISEEEMESLQQLMRDNPTI